MHRGLAAVRGWIFGWSRGPATFRSERTRDRQMKTHATHCRASQDGAQHTRGYRALGNSRTPCRSCLEGPARLQLCGNMRLVHGEWVMPYKPFISPRLVY
jgi:hypothetical protein